MCTRSPYRSAASRNVRIGFDRRCGSTPRIGKPRGPGGYTSRRLYGPADGPHLPAPAAAAEESVAAVGLEPRDADARRHVDLLEHLAGPRIDPPEIALVTFPGAVPQLAVDPRDARDEPGRFDGAEHRAAPGID